MNSFEELFSQINGGLVLDVATGQGGYITVLKQYLGEFSSITGIDSDRNVLKDINHKFPGPKFLFTQMNAEYLGFESGIFDTVNISASLHHLENVSRVLMEMKRVLRSGGKFILTEMHRDGTSEAQFNAIRIHHWAAAVDSNMGLLHDRTFARQEILDFVDELKLSNLIVRDFSNTDADPMDENAMDGVLNYLDRYYQRLHNHPGSEVLLQRGKDLRSSLLTLGFHREPMLVLVADKL